MSSPGSVSHWIGELKAGEADAAEKIWERYFRRLVGLARSKLGGTPCRASDEEDVALSAFDSFCRQASTGRFPQLLDRDNLWRLLVVITKRKAYDLAQLERRQKRGEGQVLDEAALDRAFPDERTYRGLEQMLAQEPTPDFAAQFAEAYQRLLAALDTQELRCVALRKLEGYTNAEIAAQLGCTSRTVERKLWVIRNLWAKELSAMSAVSPLDDESLPAPLVLAIDQLCDRFETALRQGQRPQIEQYLSKAPPPARAYLLHELVALELAWGRAAPLAVYRQRFPEHGELLGRAFAAASTEHKSVKAGLYAPAPGSAAPPRTPQAALARPANPTAPRPVLATPVVPDLKRASRASWWRLGLLLAGIAGVLLLIVGLAVRPAASTRQGPSTPGGRFSNSLGMEFALIPAGKFKMGSPDSEPMRQNDEGPEHDVTISQPFFLGIHEVTVGQFRAFVQKSGYRTDAEAPRKAGDKNPWGAWRHDKTTGKFIADPACNWRNPGWPQTDPEPVVCVSWNDARAFCEWLTQQENRTYRLPTEAEWEYACRGGTTTPFGLGATLSSFQANFNGEIPYGDGVRGPNRERPVKVGSYVPNKFDIYDMHGNVTEWCADYYQTRYPEGPQTDPTGPGAGNTRVYRGGSWIDTANLCRSAMRGKNQADSAFTVIGFRVVCRP